MRQNLAAEGFKDLPTARGWSGGGGGGDGMNSSQSYEPFTESDSDDMLAYEANNLPVSLNSIGMGKGRL
ncbi:hypothetical protein L3X38_036485 [Prunus dulcis]|uniref:Uncharacterized protein n=1 Tax=Prunus dulcis TaxID=3755 RepID=A0AAD4YNL6_PRUDU|nr:hypothetical protein L3X38_036454 [Prunus dulcis]KAI5316778.1 hypothetical protein L3X38_036485 [Prunus dulcis]